MPSSEDGTAGPPQANEDSPSEGKAISFDRLFGNLAKLMPNIVWQLVMSMLGKEDEQPSADAVKAMQDGWSAFFDGLGVEYVGQGMNVQLKNPLWLALLPLVSTLAAIASVFGISVLIPEKAESTPQRKESEAIAQAKPEKPPEQETESL